MQKASSTMHKTLKEVDVSGKAIGKRIKIARVLAEIPQGELGQRISVKQNVIFKMEAGKSITVERLFKIAEATGQSVGYFLGVRPLDENPKPGQLNFRYGRYSDGLEEAEAYLKMVSREGFEPSTPGLKVRCSSAELPAHSKNYNSTFQLGQLGTKLQVQPLP